MPRREREREKIPIIQVKMNHFQNWFPAHSSFSGKLPKYNISGIRNCYSSPFSVILSFFVYELCIRMKETHTYKWRRKRRKANEKTNYILVGTKEESEERKDDKWVNEVIKTCARKLRINRLEISQRVTRLKGKGLGLE